MPALCYDTAAYPPCSCASLFRTKQNTHTTGTSWSPECRLCVGCRLREQATQSVSYVIRLAARIGWENVVPTVELSGSGGGGRATKQDLSDLNSPNIQWQPKALECRIV